MQKLDSNTQQKIDDTHWYHRGHVSHNTILIVEDDDIIGKLLIDLILLETPYNAILINDGKEALEVALKIKPCLCITDYKLPSMNGLELYDQLHATEAMKNTPAIIMSASLPEEEVASRHLIGLHKPFDLDDLLHTVELLLE